MFQNFGYQFYAWGDEDLPEYIEINGLNYSFNEFLKNDFFAVTAVYILHSKNPIDEKVPSRVVFKASRKTHFLGIPLAWLGRGLCRNETQILRKLQSIQGVPRLLKIYSPNAFIYEYIEGDSLENASGLPKDYFDQLCGILEKIHKKNIAYLDMNKKSNLLVTSSGRAVIIDFQISFYIDTELPLWGTFAKAILENLQKADIYHLCKQKRKKQPEQLTPAQLELSYRKGLLIKAHRLIANPFRSFRRGLLKFLYFKKLLLPQQNSRYNSETDPSRYFK